ncbi:hypothetical protein CTEN210_06815 [Chaetoceros tenuissimus]|uniref:Ubiquitin-like domain-containing protein n=1 Tax=Chaetoceros tenuissimus TaxID=426638 RepID=A0AAD3CTH8_9STRA|nr:hypothetical protein CTEN210_06815 [Chaetoceros tenuissimus]
MAIELSQTIRQILSSHALDYLQQYYNRHGMTTPFNDAKNHYVGHLLATIAAGEDVQLSPPLHVDVLWHGHLLDTKRWRVFEKLVLDKYKESGRQTDMEHIDHSVEDNVLGRDERMERTRIFYEQIGLRFHNGDDVNANDDNLGNIGQEVHLIHDPATANNDLRNIFAGGKREDTLRVTVQDQAGNAKVFHVRKNMKVSKLVSAYAQRKGINPKDIRLFFNGNNINGSKATIEELGVEDQDLIYALLEKHGEMFMVKVLGPQGEIHFKVNRQTKASKILSAYARARGMHPNFLKIRFNGDCINESTMGDLGVEHLDLFHVVLEQH